MLKLWFIYSELAKKKNFQASSSYVSLNSNLTGALTYEQYVKLSEEDRYREELKACGLTEEEIEIKSLADGRVSCEAVRPDWLSSV